MGRWSEIKKRTDSAAQGGKWSRSSVCDWSHNKLSGNVVNNTHCMSEVSDSNSDGGEGISTNVLLGNGTGTGKGAITKRIRWPATKVRYTFLCVLS